MAAAAAQTQPPTAAGAPPAARSQHNSSLYVGDLSPDVTEAILYEIFSAVGPVASIRVCRDAVTRRSLGYAYVNYQSPNDAERALDTYNFTPILGRPCRVMWCQRDPVLRRSGVGNIFINGLEKTIDNKALYDAFSIFGDILSCKIVVDPNTGESTGRGYVHFQTAQAAEGAIQQCNGSMLNDKRITVAPFKSRKERTDEQARTEKEFTNVFIKNLPEDFSDEELDALFGKHGTITSKYVGRDADGKSKGYAFVNFSTFAEAKAAVDALNETEVKGKKVYVGRAMRKFERKNYLAREFAKRRQGMQERSKDVNLYVKNLSEEIDDDKFRKLFEEFGAISSSRVMRDERGNSKGFGFVCFNEQSDAARAVTEMNGRLIEGKPLYVSLAQRRDERRQQLSTQYRARNVAPRGAMPQFMPPNMYAPAMLYPPSFNARNFQQPNPFARFGAQQGMTRFPPMAMAQQPFMQPYPPARGQQPQQPGRQNRPGGAGRGAGAAGPQGPSGPRARMQQPNQRYSAAARNAAAPSDAAPAAPVSQMQQLASQLANADPERQKQILGDNLYQTITGFYPQEAGKLTGMLLQMDNSDLLHLIEDTSALRAEVDKAHEVLRQHQLNPQSA